MSVYIQFLVGCILYQVLYHILLKVSFRVISFPFLLINRWLVIIPLIVNTYLCGLLYAFFVSNGVERFFLNPIVLCIAFAIELFLLAFPGRRPEDPNDEILVVLGFVSKVAIIPTFIVLYLTKCSFGIEVLVLFSSLIEWVLALPVIGGLIRFLIESMSGVILILFIVIAGVFSIVSIRKWIDYKRN